MGVQGGGGGGGCVRRCGEGESADDEDSPRRACPENDLLPSTAPSPSLSLSLSPSNPQHSLFPFLLSPHHSTLTRHQNPLHPTSPPTSFPPPSSPLPLASLSLSMPIKKKQRQRERKRKTSGSGGRPFLARSRKSPSNRHATRVAMQEAERLRRFFSKGEGEGEGKEGEGVVQSGRPKEKKGEGGGCVRV